MRYLKIVLLLLLLPAWGCANLTGSSSPEPQTAPMPSSFFYDFNDIRVPSEMEIQPKKSSIAPVEGGKSGVMKFKGRVEPISLFDFFYNNMPKDGWTLLTYQKYQRYLLVFSKDNRIAVITIEEDPIYYTWTEIWVSPRVPSAAPVYSGGTQHMDTYSPSGMSGNPPFGSTLENERNLPQ